MSVIIAAKWSEKQYITGENIELLLSILTQGWIIINHPCMNIATPSCSSFYLMQSSHTNLTIG